MVEARQETLKKLDDLGIAYELVEHGPVRHMEDCAEIARRTNSVMPKNLFLAPRNERRFFLAMTRPDAPFRTSVVSGQLGSARLSFGSEERLMELLSTRPGAISPLGLFYDREKRVQLCVDRLLLQARRIAVHPCVPDATVLFARDDLLRLVAELGRDILWFDMAK